MSTRGDSTAVEDTPHGIAAAKAAGLRCIAVPATISASLDLSEADAVVRSLTEIDLTSLAGSVGGLDRRVS